MKQLIPLLIIVCLAMPARVFAAGVEVLSLSATDRLPKDIREVFVDSEGYKWLVTDGGLYQDDGYHIVDYRADIHRPDLMKSNHVTCVAEDARQRIWIGTRRGAYVLDKRTYELHPVADVRVVDHVIASIHATGDGQVWLSTKEHLLRYDARGTLAATYPVTGKVQQLYEDSRGHIWRIVWREGLARYEAERDTFVAVPWPYKEYPVNLVEDRGTGSYWVSAWGRGVARYTPQADSTNRIVWQGVTRRVSPSSERKLYNLYPWLHGKYLCGSLESGRLQLFEVTAADTLRRIVGAEADRLIPCGVNREYVHVKVDAADRLWLTGTNSDIQVLEMRDDKAQGQRYTGEATPVTLVAEEGECWLQDGFTRKYNHWNPQDGTLIRFPNSEKIIGIRKARTRRGIYAARKYDDFVHISFADGGMQTRQLFTYVLPEDENVRTFYEDETGRFWLGTNRRLMHYSPTSDRLQPVEGVQGIVHAITSDKEGMIYAITEGRHMYRVAVGKAPSTKDEVPVAVCDQYELDADFSRLFTSAQGEVWGTTQQGGIHLFSKEEAKFVSHTEAMGLTGEAIVDVAFDIRDRIWLLYSDRLIIHNPHKEGEMPYVMNAHSPSLGMEALWSLCPTATGDMYVGGTKGVVRFDSTDLVQVDSQVTVPLRLTAIQTDGELRMIPAMKETDVLRLSAADSEVKLFFSTLVPLDVERVRMAWRYRGQRTWTLLPEGSNEIHLTGLERGDHRIEVRATTTDGVWSHQQLSLTVRSPWPWYLSMWARVFYFALACALIAWGYRWLQRSIASQKAVETAQPSDQGGNMAEKEHSLTEEERFMQSVQTVIEAHLSDADYSIEEMSRDLNMSRASLHRKVKAVSGMAPTELMRIQRLNRAAELLKEGRLNVNEVAYTVGFSTPSYFTQLFKKQFGVLPTQYK